MSEQVPPFDTLDKIRTFLDDVSLGHSQSIYDTNDYEEVKNEILENLGTVFNKAEKFEALSKVCQHLYDSYMPGPSPNLSSYDIQLFEEIKSIINQGERTP